MKSFAVLASCAALIAMGVLGVDADRGHLSESADANSIGATVTATTPPEEPPITMAVPAIHGPAPLYAGEAPDSNPQ